MTRHVQATPTPPKENAHHELIVNPATHTPPNKPPIARLWSNPNLKNLAQSITLMKTSHILPLALLSTALLGIPAFAGVSSKEAAVVQSMPDQAWSWTGFYLGVQVGGAFDDDDNDDGGLKFDTDLNGAYNNSIAAFGDNFSGDFDESITYGVHAGYDYQISRIVIGALVDINRMEVSESQTGLSSTPAFYTEQREIDFLATGRLRLGFAVSERFLLFVTGGATYSDVDYSLKTNTPAKVKNRGGNGDDFGYVLGGGFEARVTEKVSLTLEYLYSNLGDGDFVTNYSGPAAFSSAAPSTNSRSSNEDFDFHTVQLKVSYRF